ncbi:MAG: BrnT family toxin [Chloroflexota bacterium]
MDDFPPGFTWDRRKARDNKRKHGVSFEAAASVFDDSAALLEGDLFHSRDEGRDRLVGRTDRGIAVVVAFTVRGDTIRIISARLARRSERLRYEAEARRRGF